MYPPSVHIVLCRLLEISPFVKYCKKKCEYCNTVLNIKIMRLQLITVFYVGLLIVSLDIPG